jgi:hypothetical protein
MTSSQEVKLIIAKARKNIFFKYFIVLNDLR